MSNQDIFNEFINSEGRIVETGGQNSDVKPTRVIIEDASSVSAKILVPQLGSDRNKLAKGEVDVRRFTNIPEVDVLWLNWFMNLPKQYGGGWAKGFCENHMNLRYSIDGENKKLSVEMVRALTNNKEDTKEPKKKGILGRASDWIKGE